MLGFQGMSNQGVEDSLRMERELPGSCQFVSHSPEETGLERGRKAVIVCLKAVTDRRPVNSY